MQIIMSICLFSEHYAIFEIVPHHEPGSTARLSSPTITKPSLGTFFCFSFEYAVSVWCCIDVLCSFHCADDKYKSSVLILEKS